MAQLGLFTAAKLCRNRRLKNTRGKTEAEKKNDIAIAEGLNKWKKKWTRPTS
jgi:hypothetical protein